jgi:hypothetical protein
MALVAYSRETFDSGALMPYGPDNIQATQRAAALVDKILKGTKPGAPADRPRRLMWNWTPMAVASVLPSASCGSRPAHPSTVEWPAVQDGAWRGQQRQRRNGSMSGALFR